ncbi:MAG: ABC transporter, partial [Betaproteobacteria bacterium]|nr:ABC transporter [Betaproteobacteria bacterium]
MKAADGTSATAAIRADPGLRTLLVLWSFAAPYRARIVVAAIALVVAAACFLVIGQGLRQVVDSGFTHGDETALNRALLSLLGIILLLSASVYLRFYNVSWLGERVVADLRKEVFSRLLAHSPAFFEEARTGELISRLTTDTALLEQVVGTSLSMAVRHVLLGIGSAVMLALTSLKLTGLVLL